MVLKVTPDASLISLYSFQISSVKFFFKADLDSAVKNVEKSNN